MFLQVKRLVLLLIAGAAVGGAGSAVTAEDSLFMGMSPPGAVAVPLPSAVFSTDDAPHGSVTFNPEQTEVYWGTFGPILYSLFDGEALSEPDTAAFNASETDGGASFSVDGSRIFFKSRRPAYEGGDSVNAIWYVERDGDSWTEPAVIDSTIEDSMYQGQITLAGNGNLYFTGRRYSATWPTLYCCRLENGVYQRPEELEGSLVSAVDNMADPFVDPQERFMLFVYYSSTPGPTVGPLALYISFRQSDSTWGTPVNLGPEVSMPGAMQRFPSMSPDGNYLFFVRNTGSQYPGDSTVYYWIDASEVSLLPCCQDTVGDVDQSGGIDITDISVLVDNQFLSLTPLVCEEEGDIDFSGVVDITDLSLLIDNQFISLTPLPECP